jgi:hypothetical protein
MGKKLFTTKTAIPRLKPIESELRVRIYLAVVQRSEALLKYGIAFVTPNISQ